jgi:hypothetical protein
MERACPSSNSFLSHSFDGSNEIRELVPFPISQIEFRLPEYSWKHALVLASRGRPASKAHYSFLEAAVATILRVCFPSVKGHHIVGTSRSSPKRMKS